VGYLRDLSASVRQALADGLDADSAVATSPIPERYTLPPQAPRAAELGDLMRHLHRLNVLATYRGLQAEVDAGGPALTPA
jgi:hypothetical protein